MANLLARFLLVLLAIGQLIGGVSALSAVRPVAVGVAAFIACLWSAAALIHEALLGSLQTKLRSLD